MPVKSFYETVCGWVKSCPATNFTAQEVCKRTEEAAFELDAPVGGDIFRWPKMSDPVTEERKNDGLHFTVRDGVGFSLNRTLGPPIIEGPSVESLNLICVSFLPFQTGSPNNVRIVVSLLWRGQVNIHNFVLDGKSYQ